MKKARATILATLFASAPALGENSVTLTFSDRQFSPMEIRVRANEPTTALLINSDDIQVVFASSSLKIKKVLVPRSKGIARWRALAPGRYPFVEEFHSEIAHGIVIAE